MSMRRRAARGEGGADAERNDEGMLPTLPLAGARDSIHHRWIVRPEQLSLLDAEILGHGRVNGLELADSPQETGYRIRRGAAFVSLLLVYRNVLP